MKKKFIYFLLFFAMVGFTSCQVTYHAVLDNPVGDKEGVAKTKPFDSSQDFTFKSAAKEGKIQKIGTTEFKITNFIIFVQYKTIVTGE